MPKLNIEKALKYIKKDLDKHFSKISFEYEVDDDADIPMSSAVADISINGLHDNIRVIVRAYEDGDVYFRAVFDKIKKTAEAYELANDFNECNAFFTAFLREDGFFELRHYFVCYEIDMLEEYSSDFLSNLIDLSEDDKLCRLAELAQR